MSAVHDCHFYTPDCVMRWTSAGGLRVEGCTILSGVYAYAWDKLMQDPELQSLLYTMAQDKVYADYVSVRDHG